MILLLRSSLNGSERVYPLAEILVVGVSEERVPTAEVGKRNNVPTVILKRIAMCVRHQIKERLISIDRSQIQPSVEHLPTSTQPYGRLPENDRHPVPLPKTGGYLFDRDKPVLPEDGLDNHLIGTLRPSVDSRLLVVGGGGSHERVTTSN